jgi:hypothetical protein
VVVDYSDESTFLPAMEGVDVVVTALGFNALEKQKDLVKVAKTAGVKLFVTTDYGVPMENSTTGIWAPKININKWFEEFGFPYARIICGGWPEHLLTTE